MTAFNPYHEWLELDPTLSSPTYYQLLGVDSSETDTAKINAAADRARNKVRSFRPGANAAQWSALLDELADAKKQLTDADARKAYDEQLASGTAPTTATNAAEPATSNPMMYPPGKGPAPAPAASTPTTPAGEATAGLPYPVQPTAAAQPTIPQANSPQAAPMAAPVAPMAAPVAPTAAPVAPIAAPVTPASTPTAPAANPMDPMAPLGVTAPANDAATPMAASVAAQPTASLPNPMDPMAPAGFSADTTAAMHSPVDNNAGVAIPIGPIPTGESTSNGPAVKGAEGPLTQRNTPSKNAWKTPAIVGGVLLAICIGGGIAWMAMNGDRNQVANADNTETTDGEKNNTDRVETNIDGSDPVLPTDGDADGPTEPTDTTEPINSGDSSEVTPEPVDPKPVDPPVEPPVEPPTDPPTPAELNQLADALSASRAALQVGDIQLARESLQQAQPVAKLPEHKAMVKRVESLADHLGKYYAAIEQGLTELKPGDEAAILHTVVKIKEAGSNGLTVEFAGSDMNFKTPADIPHALAKYIAEKGLDMNAAESRAIIGSSHAILTDDQKRNEARGWFNQAAAGGADVSGMLALLDDQYDSLRSGGPKMTEPETPDPPTTDPPTPAELTKLADALQAAKLALTKDQYDLVAFAEQIAAAKSVAKLPEHREMIANLESLGQYVKEYWIAVSAGLETLGGGTSIDVGGTTIGIVEADSNKLIVRLAGQNKTYPTPQSIPPGIAKYCAEKGMNLNDPHSRAVLGAIYAVDLDPANRARAPAYFDDAITAGVDAGKAAAALKDKYESIRP